MTAPGRPPRSNWAPLDIKCDLHDVKATLVCGVTLGEYAFIAAGAVITKDVKPYALQAELASPRAEPAIP